MPAICCCAAFIDVQFDRRKAGACACESGNFTAEVCSLTTLCYYGTCSSNKPSTRPSTRLSTLVFAGAVAPRLNIFRGAFNKQRGLCTCCQGAHALKHIVVPQACLFLLVCSQIAGVARGHRLYEPSPPTQYGAVCVPTPPPPNPSHHHHQRARG